MDTMVRVTTASEVHQTKELGILKHLCKIWEKNQYLAPFWLTRCQYWKTAVNTEVHAENSHTSKTNIAIVCVGHVRPVCEKK